MEILHIFYTIKNQNGVGGLIFLLIVIVFVALDNFFVSEENKELKKKIDNLSMKPNFQDDTARRQRNVDSIYEKKYLDSQKENRELKSIIDKYIENF